jgi:aquaglyceroporin related protein, other eukaryote
MESTERTESPDDISRINSRATSRVATRDYAEANLSRSNSQVPPRTRYADFNFGPATLRHRVSNLDRMSNLATSPSPGPTQGWRHFDQMSTRRSVAIAPTSARGDATDTASRKFSMAGPPTIDTIMANQPYVDPGYAQLNPAYDQPVNVRPVWGLAKPLPRVLRPGMVPAKDEFEKEVLEDRDPPAHPPADIEAGRIEPSLRPDKVASTLETIRREREIALVRAFEHQYSDSPTFSPFGGAAPRQSSDAPTVTPSARVRLEEPIEEEESTSDQSQVAEPLIEPPELSLPEAVAGLKAAKAEEEEIKPPYEDVVPLAAYEAEDDEVHNLHTYWSIIRLRFREPLAELLAVRGQLALEQDHDTDGTHRSRSNTLLAFVRI